MAGWWFTGALKLGGLAAAAAGTVMGAMYAGRALLTDAATMQRELQKRLTKDATLAARLAGEYAELDAAATAVLAELLPLLRSRLVEATDVNVIMRQLKAAGGSGGGDAGGRPSHTASLDADAKAALWNEVRLRCLTRLLSAVYCAVLLVAAVRLEITLFMRCQTGTESHAVDVMTSAKEVARRHRQRAAPSSAEGGGGQSSGTGSSAAPSKAEGGGGQSSGTGSSADGVAVVASETGGAAAHNQDHASITPRHSTLAPHPPAASSPLTQAPSATSAPASPPPSPPCPSAAGATTTTTTTTASAVMGDPAALAPTPPWLSAVARVRGEDVVMECRSRQTAAMHAVMDAVLSVWTPAIVAHVRAALAVALSDEATGAVWSCSAQPPSRIHGGDVDGIVRRVRAVVEGGGVGWARPDGSGGGHSCHLAHIAMATCGVPTSLASPPPVEEGREEGAASMVVPFQPAMLVAMLMDVLASPLFDTVASAMCDVGFAALVPALHAVLAVKGGGGVGEDIATPSRGVPVSTAVLALRAVADDVMRLAPPGEGGGVGAGVGVGGDAGVVGALLGSPALARCCDIVMWQAKL